MMRLEQSTFILLLYVISEINLFASSLGNCTHCNHKNERPQRLDTSKLEASNTRLKRLGHELLHELHRAQDESKASLIDDESGRTIYSSLMKILHSMKAQTRAQDLSSSRDRHHHHISDLSIAPTNLVQVSSSQLNATNGTRRSDERFREDNDSISFGSKLSGSTRGPQIVDPTKAKQASTQDSLVIEVSNEPILQHPHFEDTVLPIGGDPSTHQTPDKQRDLPNSVKFTHLDAQLHPFESNEHSLFTMSSDPSDPGEPESYTTASRLVQSDGQEPVELHRNKQHAQRSVANFDTPTGQPSATVLETLTRKRPRPISYQRVVSGAQPTRRPARQIQANPNHQPKYAIKAVRYNDYVGSSSGDSSDMDDTEPTRRPLRTIDADINNPYPQSSLQSHRGIVLQQINPAPLSGPPASYQPAPIQQHPLNSVYNLRAASSGGLKFLTKNELASNGPMGAQSWSPQQQVAHDASTNQQYPSDLQNQPQTIQVTALPYGGLNQLVRFNAPWTTNTLNGLGPNYGFSTDAFGRPVLMLNAERRQVDWPAWFYPMILIVTLPLILGALFVPLFLKTIIVLLQMLQSLGLLLPMTNAMSQQLLQATGLTNGTSLVHFELPKT